jgi:hypothetical protein
MTKSTIHQLIYVSTYNSGRIDHAPTALRDIISKPRQNNGKAGITGYLIFDGETFLQILEGANSDIEETLARIEADPRHMKVTALTRQTRTGRDFPDWTMAAYLRSPDQEEFFRAHGIFGKIDRYRLTGESVLKLAKALSTTRT